MDRGRRASAHSDATPALAQRQELFNLQTIRASKVRRQVREQVHVESPGTGSAVTPRALRDLPQLFSWPEGDSHRRPPPAALEERALGSGSLDT